MFAVNLWVPHPGESELRARAADVERLQPYLEELGLPDPDIGQPIGQDFDAQAEALLAAEPPAISFVMGVPPERVLSEARRRGIVTIGTATTVDEAVALERAGLDAVVASAPAGATRCGPPAGPVGTARASGTRRDIWGCKILCQDSVWCP